MIEKTVVQTEGTTKVRVTFTLPNCIWADAICLVGDFNDWNRRSHPLRQDRDGTWRISVDLDAGRVYQFRYLIDGERWTNDKNADAYVHNPYDNDNFLVVTDPAFRRDRNVDDSDLHDRSALS